MSSFERIVTVDFEGRRRSVLVTVLVEGGRFLLAEEVDRAGTNVGRRHLIDVAAIRRRVPMRVDNHYGELVEESPNSLKDAGEEAENIGA